MSKFVPGLFIILMLLSCKSQKMAVGDVDMDDAPIQTITPEVILKSGHAFETMKARRMNVDFKINGIADKFKANMAIDRDSMIVVSVIPLLGYEALRIICTKDSILIINRADKTYIASSVEKYLEKYHVVAEFKDVQAVLANEAFIYRSGSEELKGSESVDKVGDHMLYTIVSAIGENPWLSQTITAGKDQKIRQVMVEDFQQGINLFIRYEDFRNLGTWVFPGKVFIDIREKNYKINLDIDYGQVIFNDPVKVSLHIPLSYSRIEL